MNIQADDEALFWIARESTGSMRDAYTLFDQVVAFSDGHITYEKIRDKLGLVGIDRLNTVFENCAQGKTTEVLACLDEFLQNGISIEQLISNSADYLRSLLLIKNGVTKEALLGNSVERYSKVVLEAWSAIQIERGLSIFLQLYRDIRYSLSPRYEIELTFARICWLKDYVSNMEVKKAVDAAQKLLAGAGTIAASSVSVPTPEANAQTTGKMPDGLPPDFPRFSSFMTGGEEEESNPFPDGGSLPPEQSVTADTMDDGWANAQTPPEEDSEFEEQLQAEEAVASYEDALKKQETNDTAAAAQLDEFLTTADGRQISIAQLRGSVIAELSVNEGFIASALERTGLWKVGPDSVETTTQAELDIQTLTRNMNKVSERISNICGKPMTFTVSKENKEPEQPAEEKTLPSQVDSLVNAFKGTVV